MANPTAKNVTVMMSAVHPPHDLPYPNRRIRLTEDRRTVSVGRTSNRATEYTAQLENGFVDSPVMSRRHAEIYVDFDLDRVYIKDIGSLHGTFLNSTKLHPRSPQTLRHDDVVTFGVPVRNPPTGIIQPTTFKVAIELGQSVSSESSTDTKDPPLVFQVPDESSDSESEDDVEYSRRILNKCGVRARNELIDLTGEDGDSPDVILSSQTVMEVEVVEVASRNQSQEIVSPNKEAPVHIDVDSDEEPTMDPCQKVEESIDNEPPSSLDMDEESIRLSEHYSSESEVSGEEEAMSLDEDSESNDSYEHDDDDDDLNDDVDSDEEEEEEEEEASGIEDEDGEGELNAPPAEGTQTQLTALSEVLRGTAQPNDSYTLPPIRGWPVQNCSMSSRWSQQPETSDITTEKRASLVSIVRPPPYTPRQPDYSDRAEFFAAREENKRKLAAQAEALDLRHSQAVNEESAWAQSGDRFLNSPVESNPAQDEIKRKSPELDETSAYQFFLSKQKQSAGSTVGSPETTEQKADTATAAVTETVVQEEPKSVPVAPVAPVAPVTPAKDQGGPSMPSPTATPPRKRKAVEISENAEAMSQTPCAGKDNTTTVTGSLPTPSASESGSPEGRRPAKRLRQVANVVGLATLGGLAGGIAIFGTLVASSPSFV